MLKQIIDERWLTANAVIGLFPAARVNGDDIEIYADESRDRVLMTHHCLRQQMVKPEDRSNQSLADLIAPKESGVRDYIGAFAVTPASASTSASRRTRRSTTTTTRSC
jgi:5-methyltetrahydrofolate--homocysteine methyltransferase